MGHLNVHKAPGRSQLSKNDTGALERNGPTRTRLVGDHTRCDTTRLTERICHKGENNKRAARTCTRHPHSQNLAKLIQVPSNKTARPEHA